MILFSQATNTNYTQAKCMGDHSPRHLDFQTKERAQGAVENNDNNNNNISKNNNTIAIVCQCEEETFPLCQGICWWECKSVQSLWGAEWKFLNKLKI